MLYATHKAGGALFCLVGFEVLKANSMLADDISPWLQLVLMYPACSFGSTFPDLDHHWGSVKEHTPFSWLVHKILHLTKPKHRSWQTHCWLVTGGFIGLLFSLLYAMSVYQPFGLTPSEISLIRLIVMGFGIGVVSHLFLDTFTRRGTMIIPGVTFRLVPNSETFSTGTTYENIVRGFLYVLTGLALIWVLSPFGLQDLVLSWIGGG